MRFQVPVGGCYRLINIPMSNCINSAYNNYNMAKEVYITLCGSLTLILEPFPVTQLIRPLGKPELIDIKCHT